MKTLSLMLDCSRNAVPNIPFLKRFIDILSEIGYNELQLYTEDLYEIDDEPYFGYLRGRFTKNDIIEIDQYCISKGIELVPCIQTLAHLDNMFRWGRYESIHDFGNVLLVDEEETYAFIEKEFQTLSQMYSSRKVNIGMDEAHLMGLGKHLRKYGYENPQDMFFRHLQRVNEIAKKYGFHPMMWSDMFIRYDNEGEYYCKNPLISEKVKAKKPDNIDLVYWDYGKRDKRIYHTMIKAHQKLGCDNLRWAAACWSFTGFVPHNYYGLAAQKAAFPVMKAMGVENYMLAIWGDDGAECSKLANLPAIFHFAEMAKGNRDFANIKFKFQERFGISWSDFNAIDLPNIVDKQPLDVYNPSKYMLYNDYFLGIFDNTVDTDAHIGDKYRKYAHRLQKTAKNKEFGYIFETAAQLCKVLTIKYELGVKTREAYQTNNKEEMSILVRKYVRLERLLNDFYRSFQKEWRIENSEYGFEVQTARIGGLIQRTKDCKARLNAWIKGEIAEIPELRENIELDPYGRGKDYGKRAVVCNIYGNCFTANYK